LAALMLQIVPPPFPALVELLIPAVKAESLAKSWFYRQSSPLGLSMFRLKWLALPLLI
jgi:hypothetical protein